MATGAKNGLNPSRKQGSVTNNAGITEYDITNAYATSIFKGDLVKLGSTGTIELAAAGDLALGAFLGCSYTKSDGTPTEAPYWPASTSSSTTPKAKIDDAAFSLYNIPAEGAIPLVEVGDLYALEIGTGSTITGNSAAQVKTNPEETGDVDIDGSVDLPTDTDVTANDTFTIKTSAAGASAVTITFVASYDTVTLLTDLNAVDNIAASVDATSGFLIIQATDGNNLVVAEGVGTPYIDLMGTAAGTFVSTVAIGASAVKVTRIVDVDNSVLEVAISKNEFRDNV